MVLNAQRTIFATQLQLAMFTGSLYTVKPNTTLNEKLDIAKEVSCITLPSNVYPKLKYYTIGIGGEGLTGRVKGWSYNTHTAIDGALYNQIPFVLRPVDSDLTSEEKIKYRFRKRVFIDNKEYFAYYLKVIDNINFPEEIYVVTQAGSEQKLNIFNTNNEKILNPTPVYRDKMLEQIKDSTFIIAQTKLQFTFSPTDISELEKVYEVLKLEKVPLTEIGVCTGYDDMYKPFGENNTYIEAISVQLAYHIGTSLDLAVKFGTSDNFRRMIDIGCSEPLYIGMM